MQVLNMNVYAFTPTYNIYIFLWSSNEISIPFIDEYKLTDVLCYWGESNIVTIDFVVQILNHLHLLSTILPE